MPSVAQEKGLARPKVAIIGTGFGGLGAAIELKRAGYDDIVILEKADDVGGVWRENTYPGAACDIPSPYYSYSFEQNPNWPRRFSTQPAILDYIRHVADKYDLKRHIRFGTTVEGADYDDAAGNWVIHTSGGDITADVFIPAVGQLSRPAMPNIKGVETFRGAAFHSAEWNHDIDLTGKRVAVIGTGASAIQFVPEIQPKVASLELFQRTPPHILPRPDTEFGRLHHVLFNKLPATLHAERYGWYSFSESLAVALHYSKLYARGWAAVAKRHLHSSVADPELRKKLWPDYQIGCKRILFSSNYYPALTQPNVDVITDGIAEITETGVRTRDGVVHEVDVIIYGTGFKTTDIIGPLKIRGQHGADLQEQWAKGASAFLGVSVPNFPNFFLMYGPNTNLGSGSIISMLEAQATHIRKALDHAKDQPLVVRADKATEFDVKTQERLVDGVWSHCSSWYRNADGRVVNNWPGTVTEYITRTTRFNPADYEVAK